MTSVSLLVTLIDTDNVRLLAEEARKDIASKNAKLKQDRVENSFLVRDGNMRLGKLRDALKGAKGERVGLDKVADGQGENLSKQRFDELARPLDEAVKEAERVLNAAEREEAKANDDRVTALVKLEDEVADLEGQVRTFDKLAGVSASP